MGFRAADVVVAVRGITNPITGRSVTRGTQGVIVKQLGCTPALFRVRFGNDAEGSVILDDVTSRDICHRIAELDEPVPGPAAKRFGIPEQGYLHGGGGQPRLLPRGVPDEGSDLAGQTRRSSGRSSRAAHRTAY